MTAIPPARAHRTRAGRLGPRHLLATAGILAALWPIPGQAETPSHDLRRRLALCERSIELAGLQAIMDADIRQLVNDATRDLAVEEPAPSSSLAAYRDSLRDALMAAKAPVLAKLTQTCAAAFTTRELTDINAFYASASGRAWLEKSRTLMLPALAQAVDETGPQIIADVRRRFCARVGGCEDAPPAPTTAADKRKL